MNIGEIVWFIDSYDNLVTGTVISVFCVDGCNDGKFANVTTGYGSRCVKISDCYSSKELCILAYKDRAQKKKDAYTSDINSVEDLVRFMYSHNVCPAEEYTDCEARCAAVIKASEFGIILE